MDDFVAALGLTSLKHLGASRCTAATVNVLPLVQLPVFIMQTKRGKKDSQLL